MAGSRKKRASLSLPILRFRVRAVRVRKPLLSFRRSELPRVFASRCGCYRRGYSIRYTVFVLSVCCVLFLQQQLVFEKTNHCMDCSISVVSILLLMLNIIYINCGAAYASAPQDTLPDEFVQFIDGCMPCQPGQVNIFVLVIQHFCRTASAFLSLFLLSFPFSSIS